MAVTAATHGGTAAASGFDAAWTNPENAVVDNDSYATCTVDSQGDAYSQFLDITNFGFALAAGDTVTSVLAEVACKKSAGTIIWSLAQIIKAGSPVGDTRSPGNVLGTTEAYLDHTGTVVQYGTTVSGTEANNSGFGIRIQFQCTVTSGVVSVDAVRLTLTYTEAAGGSAPRVLQQYRSRRVS